MSHVATGTFMVKLAPLAFEGADPESKLARMSINKEITGDLVATSMGQMLSAMTDTQGSAGYVAMEKVTGSLHGRKGSFVLQHSGSMDRGTPSLSVVVVADSGTDELTGMTGQCEIAIKDGEHSYKLTYHLPASHDD
ncbi:MAG: DUF3224 domain-containing protein [Xanthomonadales bacterium]|nr:DUF3224 domain-containing protein [Xanthomonadales bacterium]